MPRAIKEETVGTEERSRTIDLLDRVGALRTDAFDLLDALTRRSTRTRGNSALPAATSAMQGLVNVLGDVQRLLSQKPKQTARSRRTPAERR
jgi:hypothetical protein